MRISSKRSVVVISRSLTSCNILVQMRKFSIQYSSLNSIQTRVHTYRIVVVAHHHTMISNRTHLGSQLIIIGKDCTTIAITSEVLGWEETGTTNLAHGGCLFLCAVGESIYRTNGLARILYNIQVILLSNLHECLHVRTLSEQVHGHNGFGLRRNGLAHCLYRDIHRIPIHIHYHRLQPQQRHHFGSSDKRKGRGNHLISRLQTQCHKRNLQRIGAIAHWDNMFGACILLQIGLKSRHRRTFDKTSGVYYSLNTAINIFFDVLILRLQIYHLNFLHILIPNS